MIIYIAGPITNNAEFREQFAEAEKVLEEQGHIVINPALLPQGLGDCDDYMHICLSMIDKTDAVVMLKGWERSFGACREWGYAMAMDKIICPFEELEDKKQ